MNEPTISRMFAISIVSEIPVRYTRRIIAMPGRTHGSGKTSAKGSPSIGLPLSTLAHSRFMAMPTNPGPR